jgi:hypothetical protein
MTKHTLGLYQISGLSLSGYILLPVDLKGVKTHSPIMSSYCKLVEKTARACTLSIQPVAYEGLPILVFSSLLAPLLNEIILPVYR